MHLILNAHSSNHHYTGDCDYAIVDLTPALAEQIRHRVAVAREARQKADDLSELYFWGSTAAFYDHAILDACHDAVATAGRRRRDKAARDWLANFEQTEYAVLPAGVDLDAHEPQRTEYDQVILRIASYSRRLEFSVVWTASPKYADLDVTTSELPVTAMGELLAATAQPVT